MDRASNTGLPLVFTDLDGSLLDHHTYAIEPARPALRCLAQLNIPVIPCTSKTQAELEPLRNELGLDGPFVAENGAACFLPKAQFIDAPLQSVETDNYWVLANSKPRSYWLKIIDQIRPNFGGEFTTFAEVGTVGIMALTQLSKIEAQRANQRQYSEPVHWTGSESRRAEFIQKLQQLGASVLQGGRFLSVSGDCDKGRALRALQASFVQQNPGREVVSLAIGDSANDIAMLEAADHALIIRSPVHSPPRLQRQTGFFLSALEGPAGWNEGVMQWLPQVGVFPHLYPISE